MKTERRTGPAQPFAQATQQASLIATSTRDSMTTKSEEKKQRELTKRLDAAKRRIDRIKREKEAEERAELLAKVPDMPTSMRRVLATADLDVVRAMIKSYLATKGDSRAVERAEIARRMGRAGAAPTTASHRSGRSQVFPTLTAAAARKLIKKDG